MSNIGLGRSGGMYCFYKDCKNKFYKNEGVKFFRFPKEENRCRIWIKACGREDVLLNNDTPFNSATFYQKYRLCSAHFEDNMFNNPFEKSGLLPTAEPIHLIKLELN